MHGTLSVQRGVLGVSRTGKAWIGKGSIDNRSAADRHGVVLESVLQLAIWKISDWKNQDADFMQRVWQTN